MMTGGSCYEKARNLRMCRLIRSMASIDKSRVIGGELSMRNRKKGICDKREESRDILVASN
jgi:hypothetical protein